METRGIGKRLLHARRLRMWTQGRLASKAGVSPTTVSGIESGRISSPHFGTVRKLAMALSVDPRNLISSAEPVGTEASAPLSLEWAQSIRVEEFERGLEEAQMNQLQSLHRELGEERGRLQALYGAFPEGSEQRRFIKRQIRIVAAHSGSVATSMLFHEDGNTEHTDGDERRAPS